MDIDILFTAEGEAGLIASRNLSQKAIGLLFDGQTGLLQIEFADMDQLEMNIPLDDAFWDYLDNCTQLHFGSVIDDNIGQAYQIPILFLDDPYRGAKLGMAQQYAQPLAAFDHFIKRAASGQPIHREDLGDDAGMGCILGDASPAALQFAPHLARAHALEVRPSAAPSAPGMSAPGLGGSTSARSTSYRDGGSSDGQPGDKKGR